MMETEGTGPAVADRACPHLVALRLASGRRQYAPKGEALMEDLPGYRPPQQQRSRRAVERMLAAGADVLRESGYEGFSIAEVCEQAGVSSGALYARFDGKDTLLQAIHRNVMAQIIEESTSMYQSDAEWAGLSAEETIERAVRLLVDHFNRNAAILRVFILRSAVDDWMRRSGANSIVPIAQGFSARVRAHADKIRHRDPEAAIESIFGLAFQTLSHDVAFGGEFWEHSWAPSRPVGDLLPIVCRQYLLSE